MDREAVTLPVRMTRETGRGPLVRRRKAEVGMRAVDEWPAEERTPDREVEGEDVLIEVLNAVTNEDGKIGKGYLDECCLNDEINRQKKYHK